MTKENGPYVEEEDIELGFEPLLSDLRLEIIARLCESADSKAQALVRREERQLELRGDVSLPSLNSKIWVRHQIKADASLSSLLPPSKDDPDNCTGRGEKERHVDSGLKSSRSILKVVKVKEVKGGAVAIHLDRAAVIKHYITICQWSNYCEDKRELVLAKNCDPSPSHSLTSARVRIFTECLNRLPLSSEHVVSSTSFPPDASGIKVRVGPVLGGSGRKEDKETIEQVEERVRENVGKLDEERRDENEAVEMTQERLQKLSKAFLNFAFLSSAISNPAKIDMRSQQSHFVMYNKARLTRLLATFDEQVKRGVYPPVPTDLQQINFSLLIEPEEWELVWGHLIWVEEVINHCTKALSFHKLVNLLHSLATTYSRYYNRVKMLKDPLPSLVPSIHARVVLTRQINAVFARLLHILGCKPLDTM